MGGYRMKTAVRIMIGIASLILIVFIVIIALSPPWLGGKIAREKGLLRPMVIAHRGASYWAPELTIPAFETARDLGADYLETDVQRTKDGVLIMIHDDDLVRTTDVKIKFPDRKNYAIGGFTSAEIDSLDAGSWFNAKNPDRARKGFAGLKIPTFEEYMNIPKKGVHRPGLLIELKKPHLYPGIEQQVLMALAKNGWLSSDFMDDGALECNRGKDIVSVGCGKHRVILQSFEEASIKKVKSLAPGLVVNFLADEEDVARLGGFNNVLAVAGSIPSEVGPSGYNAWPWNVGKAHRRNMFFFVYTIDKKAHFYLFTLFGVDGMITNRCDQYMDFIGRRPKIKAETLLMRYEK